MRSVRCRLDPTVASSRMVVGLLATVAYARGYPLIARRCRFTYSQSLFVMLDGGMGALPNSASSVSVHPLKQTWYPPNGTFFAGLPFPFALAFAIASSLP